MYPALHPCLAPWHLYWEFWLYPRNELQILFIARASVSRSCSSAFSITDLEQIFPLMWQRTQNRSAGLSFLYPCFYIDVALHALLSVVNCVWAFPQEFPLLFPRRHSKKLDPLRCWQFGNCESRNTTQRNPSAVSSPPGKTRVKKVITLTSK